MNVRLVLRVTHKHGQAARVGKFMRRLNPLSTGHPRTVMSEIRVDKPLSWNIYEIVR